MATSRRIEVFSAGCAVCEETVMLINKIACPSCDVEILDMHKPEVAKKARQYGGAAFPPWRSTASWRIAVQDGARTRVNCAQRG